MDKKSRKALFPSNLSAATSALRDKATLAQREAFERSWRTALWLVPYLIERAQDVSDFFSLGEKLGVKLTTEQVAQAVRQVNRSRVARDILGNVDAQTREPAGDFFAGYSPSILLDRRDRRTHAGADGRVALFVSFLVAFNQSVHGFATPTPVVYALAELSHLPQAQFPRTRALWKTQVEAWRKRRTASSASEGPSVKESVRSFERFIVNANMSEDELRDTWNGYLQKIGATRVSASEYEALVDKQRKRK